MALNANALAQEWFDIEQDFNERDISDLNAARLEINRRKITALFNHLKQNGVVLPGTMAAPSGGGPVTGIGKIE